MINNDLKPFSRDLFNNYDDLRSYLSGKRDLEKIKSLAENPISTQPLQTEEGRLKILGQFSTELILFPSLILSKLAYKIGLKHFGSFIKIAAGHLYRDFRPNQVNGVPVVVPAINLPKMEESDIYMCQDLPFDLITDPRIRRLRHLVTLSGDVGYLTLSFYWQLFKICVRNRYFLQAPIIVAKAIAEFARVFMKKALAPFGWVSNVDGTLLQSFRQLKDTYPWVLSEKPIVDLCDKVDEIHEGFQKPIIFYNRDGSCRGASEWFIHLCLHSRKFFKDSEKWLEAVAQQFKKGIPGQGAVLQSVFNPTRILNHQIYSGLFSHKVSYSKLNEKHESAIDKIKNLRPGIYCTDVYHHVLVYIKLENGKSYTWDPNFGLLKHNAIQLRDHIVHYYPNKDAPKKEIRFYRHRLFRWIPQTF